MGPRGGIEKEERDFQKRMRRLELAQYIHILRRLKKKKEYIL